MRTCTLIAGFVVASLLGGMTAAHAQESIPQRMARNHAACNAGDRGACVRFGILVGENRERRAEWRREHPDWWWWER